MEKVKRNERLAVMTQVLTASPNKIFTYSYFGEMFASGEGPVAKSTICEDIDILKSTMQRFNIGRVETVTGAAGGVRYRPMGVGQSAIPFLQGICDQLSDPSRRLPGGYLYFSDILSTPTTVEGMANILASEYFSQQIHFVLTMETRGIPVATMTARALGVPLVIARRASKVYEGSAVNLNYLSGSGNIETMSLSRRAVKEGQRVLIVDDFLRGGGTARGMVEMMKEFNVTVAGICFVLASKRDKPLLQPQEKALMTISGLEDGGEVCVQPADWIR